MMNKKMHLRHDFEINSDLVGSVRIRLTVTGAVSIDWPGKLGVSKFSGEMDVFSFIRYDSMIGKG